MPQHDKTSQGSQPSGRSSANNTSALGAAMPAVDPVQMLEQDILPSGQLAGQSAAQSGTVPPPFTIQQKTAAAQERPMPQQAWSVAQRKQIPPQTVLQRKVDISLHASTKTQTSTGQPVVQRVTTQILKGNKDGVIGGIAVAGRPQNLYSNSKGDHTTAFTVVEVGLDTLLKDKTIREASLLMADLVNKLYQLPGMEYRKNLPEEHERRLAAALEQAHASVNFFRKWRKENVKKQQQPFITGPITPEQQDLLAEPFTDNPTIQDDITGEEIGWMQHMIDSYLEARELVPLTALNTQSLNAALAGKGKGESARPLAKNEQEDSVDVQTLAGVYLNLFDARAAALLMDTHDPQQREKLAPGAKPVFDDSEYYERLLNQHYQTLNSFYPKTLQKLRDNDAFRFINNEIYKRVAAKIEENRQARQTGVSQRSQRGPTGSATNKRYITSSISIDEGSRIQHLKIEGRPRSPFPSTMGAHTTAWVVITDRVWSGLIRKTIPEAAAELLDIGSEIQEQLESLAKIFDADSKQMILLINAWNALEQYEKQLDLIAPASEEEEEDDNEKGKEIDDNEKGKEIDDDEEKEDDDEAEVGSMEISRDHLSTWDQVLILQEVIVAALELINLVPGVSLYKSNTNGDQEGSRRRVLLNYSAHQPEDVKVAILGMLDISNIADHFDTIAASVDREKEEEEEGNEGLPEEQKQYSQRTLAEPEYRDIVRYTYSNTLEDKELNTPVTPTRDINEGLLLLLSHHLHYINKAYPGVLAFARIPLQPAPEEAFLLILQAKDIKEKDGPVREGDEENAEDDYF